MLKPLALLACLLSTAMAADAAIVRDGNTLRVDLDGGVRLGFALREGMLLGLQTAEVGGVALKSPTTCARPFLAQEWVAGARLVNSLRLTAVDARADGGVAITCELLATRDEAAFRRLYVYAGDHERALGEGMTPELAALKARKEAADAAFATALRPDPAYAAILANIAKREAELAAAADATARIGAENRLRKDRAKLDRLAAERTPALIAADPALARAQAERDAFTAALDARALQFGRIHRDYYRFAHLQLPAEVCAPAALVGLAATPAAEVVGTLRWIITPTTRTLAGWQWRGWTQHYEVALHDGMPVTALRELGSWELGGDAVGTTVVNLRYRGLGGIERTFAAGPGGGVAGSFTTTEILPGAVGGAPVISPSVPATVAVDDRGYGLLHRAGAWICRTARGAGTGFVDFQYRDLGAAGWAAHTAFPARQGCLRALTEAYPGDRVISQTDEELFPLSTRFATTPMIHLALVAATPFAADEARTRWHEVDQEVRDVVSAELGFVQFEPLPAVGCNYDNGFGGRMAGLAQRMDALGAAGVRQLMVHHPGWMNGRDREPGAAYLAGGDCAIQDWKPLTSVQPGWKALNAGAKRNGIAHYAWLTGMSAQGGPFHAEVGAELTHWAINAPGDTTSAGYPPHLFNHNIFDQRCRELLLARLDGVRREYGYQGFWADSFQNLFMSTLDWSSGTGASLQRAWWEQIAAWTREGTGWMSESHSFPGLSCSIEVAHDPEGVWWFYPHVQRWYRTDLPGAGTPVADRHAFRMMANKGWLSPQARDQQPGEVIPSFSRLAHEYLAALPAMRRPYLMPGELGVLWLPYSGDGEGVWFSFSAQPVPAGVTAVGIVDGVATATASDQRTYRVRAANLLAAFAVRRPPQADERLGRAYTAPTHTYPEWTK